MLIDISSSSTEISNFVNVLKKELPNSLHIINYIQTCHKWKVMNDELQISLLCTERSVESGVFIGVVKPVIGNHCALVTFYAFDNYDNDLKQALKYMQFDWKSVGFFEVICQKHVPILEELITDRGLTTKYIYPCIFFNMTTDEALKIDVQCPENIIISPLNDQHADEMYKMWIMSKWLSIDAVKYSIRYNREAAYGIFCKNTGEILTRCIRSHVGMIAALQTVEKARNKGYAKLLLKYVSKKMAENGVSPCSSVTIDNESSLKVHRSIGYKDVSQVFCYGISRGN